MTSPNEPPKPDRDGLLQISERMRRLLKVGWAVTIASLLLADLTLPRMVELEGWHDLIDRCLGNDLRQTDAKSERATMVRSVRGLFP
jgi:hypothetical protein